MERSAKIGLGVGAVALALGYLYFHGKKTTTVAKPGDTAPPTDLDTGGKIAPRTLSADQAKWVDANVGALVVKKAEGTANYVTLTAGDADPGSTTYGEDLLLSKAMKAVAEAKASVFLPIEVAAAATFADASKLPSPVQAAVVNDMASFQKLVAMGWYLWKAPGNALGY